MNIIFVTIDILYDLDASEQANCNNIMTVQSRTRWQSMGKAITPKDICAPFPD